MGAAPRLRRAVPGEHDRRAVRGQAVLERRGDAERDAAIAAFGAGGVEGRAAALLSVADSASVYNKQYNPAFVLMQYIGYPRRNPNDAPDNSYAGFDFWLAKLNAFSLPGEDVRNEEVARRRVARAEMVRAFIISGEYRGRFGP